VTDSNFHERSEHELSRLDDESLLAYLLKARAAGHIEAATSALRVLVWGYLDIVEMRVRLKVPGHEVDEVVASIMESALKSAFDGTSGGEFRSWVHTIADRRIADYHRRNRLDIVPLPDGSEESGGRDIPQPADEGTVDLQRAIDVALGELGGEHRAVIDLYVFADLTAGDVAAQTGESEANVHQIGSRFRKRLRALLSADDDGDTGARR
jgi:RNA polymerase sigma factor (sigma-70 family)